MHCGALQPLGYPLHRLPLAKKAALTEGPTAELLPPLPLQVRCKLFTYMNFGPKMGHCFCHYAGSNQALQALDSDDPLHRLIEKSIEEQGSPLQPGLPTVRSPGHNRDPDFLLHLSRVPVMGNARGV